MSDLIRRSRVEDRPPSSSGHSRASTDPEQSIPYPPLRSESLASSDRPLRHTSPVVPPVGRRAGNLIAFFETKVSSEAPSSSTLSSLGTPRTGTGTSPFFGSQTMPAFSAASRSESAFPRSATAQSLASPYSYSSSRPSSPTKSRPSCPTKTRSSSPSKLSRSVASFRLLLPLPCRRPPLCRPGTSAGLGHLIQPHRPASRILPPRYRLLRQVHSRVLPQPQRAGLL